KRHHRHSAAALTRHCAVPRGYGRPALRPRAGRGLAPHPGPEPDAGRRKAVGARPRGQARRRRTPRRSPSPRRSRPRPNRHPAHAVYAHHRPKNRRHLCRRRRAHRSWHFVPQIRRNLQILGSSSMEDVAIVDARPEDAEGLARVQKATWLSTYPSAELGISQADLLSKDFDSPKKIASIRQRLSDQSTDRTWVAKAGD